MSNNVSARFLNSTIQDNTGDGLSLFNASTLLFVGTPSNMIVRSDRQHARPGHLLRLLERGFRLARGPSASTAVVSSGPDPGYKIQNPSGRPKR